MSRFRLSQFPLRRAVIFEVAAMNNRQKRMGYNAAVEFTEQMSKYFTARNDD